jgi:hypothetical protein
MHRCIAVILTLALLGLACDGSHQSDQAMENHLLSRGAEFNRLISMFGEDGHVNSIGFSYVFMENDTAGKPDESRLKEYRELFKKLGLTRIGRSRGGIDLSASTKDVLIARSHKNFYYTSYEPLPLVESVDQISQAGGDRRDQAPVFKKIKDNWYLYYECY